MTSLSILIALIGLLPDENNQNILRPHPSGGGSRQPCKSFRCVGAFGLTVKEISLTNSPLKVLVDDEDYELLAQRKWYLERLTRGRHIKIRVRSTSKPYVLMHSLIMNTPKGMETDHRNHDCLDNQKYNLRVATTRNNSANKKMNKHGHTSRFKGVCRDWSRRKLTGKWIAYINPGRRIYLGKYATEEEAALAYNVAAQEYFGEFAWLNHI